ncbi:virion protein 1 [Sus scrofa polyomavirus 1]|uniref:Capsid protein VP1 n=1 Tax=Sus scrofa polyomavirus 1 TaxID=1680894 RepID=A0A161CCA4_9POLY|nr:virion protein 1 [Sus scrofa polyomavirus 1]AKQ44353.1 virion protein 1 [Sus scrofa polyomavirus 1]
MSAKRRKVCPAQRSSPRCAPKDICGRPCPKPANVPKLIIKGGIEVLDVVTGPDSITQIELYLEPRMGIGVDASQRWYGYSYDITPNQYEDGTVPKEDIPCYSAARVQLPMLNEDMTCGTLTMWEAVSVKTEVVGIHSLVTTNSFYQKALHENGAGTPIQGLNFHMFAVGGEPLELQGLMLDYKTTYQVSNGIPIIIDDSIGKAPTPLNQTLDPAAKTVLNKDGAFPIELWGPDPSRNENTRYFGSYTGGSTTPPVLQFTNTLTTVLLDENGVGPLCKGDGLFLTAADICGFITKPSGKMALRGLPRYFNVTLRKRVVKNPYPVTSLLSSLFSNLMPKLQGQPMEGEHSQVEEVRIYEGTEPVPSDPDVVRMRDKFGKEITVLPRTL